MGLFSFGKDNGKNIFGSITGQIAAAAARTVVSNDQKADTLRKYLADSGIQILNLGVQFSGESEVTLSGQAMSTADAEKAALLAGNVAGIDRVVNNITAGDNGMASDTYTVEKGDSLWKIAEARYGNGSKYNLIFEANRPMIKDADDIYPGQVLRIPALG